MADKKEKNLYELSTGRLEMIITIVNRKRAYFYLDFIQSFEANLQCSLLCEGTARAEVLDMVGLADNKNVIIFSIVREDRTKEILTALEEKFKTIRSGKGVAFSVSLSSMIGVSVYSFLANKQPGGVFGAAAKEISND